MNAHHTRFSAIISSRIQRLSPAYYYGQDTVFILTPTELLSERFCRREKCTEDVPPAPTLGPKDHHVLTTHDRSQAIPSSVLV